MAYITEIEQTDTIIIEAVQSPMMRAGSHEALIAEGYEVSGEGEDWIEYDSDDSWVKVDRHTRQVLDFG